MFLATLDGARLHSRIVSAGLHNVRDWSGRKRNRTN